MFIRSLFFFTAIAVLVTSGYAETQEISVPAVDEIIIEESEEAKAMKERKESAYSKTVITKKELEELGGKTAADVLRRMPRLYFSGPPATNKDIRMFGLDKEFQNVLINGNRPPGGGEKREFALDRIPVEMIERIEIVKNPTASYDADSIAGLVNIVLKDSPKTMQFSSSTALSYNDLADKTGTKLSVTYGNNIGPSGFFIGGTRNDEYRGKAKEIEDPAPAKNERETEDELVRTITSSLNLAFSYDLGKHHKLMFKPYFLNQEEQKAKEKMIYIFSTGAPKSKNIEDEDKEQLLQNYSVEWKHKASGGSSFTISGSYSKNAEDKDKKTDQFTTAGLTFNKSIFETEKKEDEEIVLSADYKTPLSDALDIDHLISMGVKYRGKNRDVEKLVFEINNAGIKKTTSTPDDSYHVRETISSFYFMDEASISENVVVTPGVRLEITDGEYETSGDRKGAGRFDDWNPSLHTLFKLGKGFQIRASVARTIGRPPFKDKVPTRSEKKDKIEEGNPDLKAAKSINYEASIEKYFGKAGIVSFGAFYKDIEDIIEKQQIGIDPVSSKPVIRPVNVSEATLKGVELEAKTDLGFIDLKDFTVIGNYTILHSEVKDPNTGTTRRLKDQPKTLANIILRYDSKKLGLAASVGMNYVGKKIDESDPTKPKKVEKAFTQWDFSVNKTLFKQTSFFASVTNLFNEKREKTEGIKTETEKSGRTFFAGLRYEL